jgi:hypothetical protein
MSTVAKGTISIADSGQPQAGNEPPGIIVAAVSTLPLPVTSPGPLSETRPINTTESSLEVSSQATPEMSPIRELWNQAYDDLRAKEENLVKDYEAVLSGNLIISESNSGRAEQMKIILKGKVAEVNQNMWKLKFGANEIPVKDLMGPVVGIIGWANEYINAAVSANPYASLAWAGVGLLLPVSNTFQSPFTCL